MTNRGQKVVILLIPLNSFQFQFSASQDKTGQILTNTGFDTIRSVCLFGKETFCDVTLAITDSNPLSTQLCFEDYDGE